MAGKTGMRKTTGKGLRARAWWCLRKNKRMTLADFLMTLNDDNNKVPDRNLGMYLNALSKVGIVSKVRVYDVHDKKPTSNGVYLYILVKDVGAKNPVLRADGVYDPNSQKLLVFKQVDLPGFKNLAGLEMANEHD